MKKTEKGKKQIKSKLHPRNKHKYGYDFDHLINAYPSLGQYIITNKYQNKSINFFDSEAIKALNKALLMRHYAVEFWDIPSDYLCPPIPSRADYIHYMADLLGENNAEKIPRGKKIQVLDIGVGANMVYPIIGHQEYGWSFCGTDIDPVALQNARQIIAKNPAFTKAIRLKEQTSSTEIFFGIIDKKDHFDLTICNPPFYSSEAEAKANTLRKLKNLQGQKVSGISKNFGGQASELWCEGGEKKFVRRMIKESKKFAANCLWFSTLIAKETHLKPIYQTLKKANATTIKTIEMTQGNKLSRIVAWTFLGEKRRSQWVEKRWGKW